MSPPSKRELQRYAVGVRTGPFNHGYFSPIVTANFSLYVKITL